MKTMELQPTRENLIDTLSEDLLDRNVSLYRFISLLDHIEGCQSISIDAPWGAGKTFFVKQAKLVLDAFNPTVAFDSDEERNKITGAMTQFADRSGENDKELQPQVCVYYDAWSNDNDVDPLLSLVYSIVTELNSDYSFKHAPGALKPMGELADILTGKDISDFFKALKSEDALKEIKQQKSLQDMVSEFLDSLIPEKGNRLVIFIDELDRCKPSYAVRLLERVKHYFSNECITFVFSVNKGELQHTVRRFYGDEFNASRYLDRFFDLQIALPPANMRKYMEKIGLYKGNYVFEDVCKAVIEAFHLELREIEKFYRIAKIAAYDPTHNKRYSFSFSEERGTLFCLMTFVPIMIGLKVSNQERYEAFVQGRDASPLFDILLDKRFIDSSILSVLLSRSQNETFIESAYGHNEKSKAVSAKDKLETVYKNVFPVNRYTIENSVCVGEIEITPETHEEVSNAVSLLSGFALYE